MGKECVGARERGSDTLLQMCLHSWVTILGKQGGPTLHTWLPHAEVLHRKETSKPCKSEQVVRHACNPRAQEAET